MGPASSFDSNRPQWPMTYVMKPPQGATPPPRWWCMSHYRGPQGQSVEVLYSKTKTQSEEVARLFVNEPVLGFDMEWPMDADRRPKLQDKVALIQLASERTVALFHIALHTGNTVNDFIAPTLKEIIESPKIIKAGVAIMSADFKRLRTCFNLDPRGAFELSHLHNLVTTPEAATTRLRALSAQVEEHLGLPLWKGSVRTSNWSKPLTPQQVKYAAADAYAGFMLFHCMNAKRLAMDSFPPLPRFCEKYLPFAMEGIVTIQLESVTDNGEAVKLFRPGGATRNPVAARACITHSNTEIGGDRGGRYYADGVSKDAANLHQRPQTIGTSTPFASEPSRNRPSMESPGPKQKAGIERQDPSESSLSRPNAESCDALYRELVSRRKVLAELEQTPPYIIAQNTVLRESAFCRPTNEEEVLRVPGIRIFKAEQYGKSWPEVIANFEAEHNGRGLGGPKQQASGDNRGQHTQPKSEAETEAEAEAEAEAVAEESEATKIVRAGRYSKEILIPPDRFPAGPSTGLAFRPSDVELADGAPAPPQSEKPNGFDNEDSMFGPPIELPSPSTLKRKRATSIGIEGQSYPREKQTRVHVLGGQSFIQGKEAPISTPPLPSSGAVAPPQTTAKTPGWERVILRKKLDAYVKRVIWAMNPKPTEPLASENAFSYLVTTLPRTKDEFRRVPGMQRLVQVCEVVNMDVWRAFESWTQGPEFAKLRP
ncbi:hypothetical protein GGR50DRAFT_700894 [Xylaria sp. CBS 124048]|nr:hypothetical protein GGR50DRAFT_700894 [Xylaria sp. CBS 124048]